MNELIQSTNKFKNITGIGRNSNLIIPQGIRAEFQLKNSVSLPQKSNGGSILKTTPKILVTNNPAIFIFLKKKTEKNRGKAKSTERKTEKNGWSK